MSMAVRITDVSPRDGLQNEPRPIPAARKIELVRRLCAARVDEIEVTSFVSPKWVPQLADAAEVLRGAAELKPAGVSYSVLVPNEAGMRAALECNRAAGVRLIDKIALFTAASETFSKRNTNATIAETMERFRPVVRAARGDGLLVRGYVSCAVRCPFAGDIAPPAVAEVAMRLLDLGVDELDLADTIGAATPASTCALLDAVRSAIDSAAYRNTTLHLHDTSGQAAACAIVALDLGIRSFDASAGGLGGCPYASTPGRRAPGNIATGVLLKALKAAGCAARIDEAKLADAEGYARSMVGGCEAAN